MSVTTKSISTVAKPCRHIIEMQIEGDLEAGPSVFRLSVFTVMISCMSEIRSQTKDAEATGSHRYCRNGIVRNEHNSEKKF